MKKILVSIVLMFSAYVTVSGFDRITGLPFASRSEIIVRNGMAATSQPLAIFPLVS